MPAPLKAEIEIDAAPEDVWPLVADLRRSTAWSPTTWHVLVSGTGPIGTGSRALNINRLGWRIWPTRSKVVDYDEPHRFAFRITDNKSIWSYQLEPLDSGTRTRLTERREVPDGVAAHSRKLIDLFLGGEKDFESALLRGMDETLTRIKRAAEDN